MHLRGGFVFSAPQPRKRKRQVYRKPDMCVHTHARRQRPTRPPVSIMTPDSFGWSHSPRVNHEKVFGSQVASALCGPFSIRGHITPHHVAATQVILQDSSASQDEPTRCCDDTQGLNSFLEIFQDIFTEITSEPSFKLAASCQPFYRFLFFDYAPWEDAFLFRKVLFGCSGHWDVKRNHCAAILPVRYPVLITHP